MYFNLSVCFFNDYFLIVQKCVVAVFCILFIIATYVEKYNS